MSTWRSRALRGLAVLHGVVVMVGVVEVAGRVFLRLRPSYLVLFLQPDPSVGWKLVPRFSFGWTGVDWYATEFSVPVRTNSLGVRDLERETKREAGTMRAAFLGDSFVEALQVPREQTAGALLELGLNTPTTAAPAPPPRFGVLNFGVSNHGVGQFLLVWEAYAKRFAPDYVLFPVADFLYVPAYRRLREARRGGRALRWRTDPHFNEEGHRVLADALHRAIRADLALVRS